MAAYYGYLGLLKNNNLVFIVNTMDWAARNNHLEVIKWLHTNRAEGCITDAINYAVSGSLLDVTNWLNGQSSLKN
jgi:hypothetical protein